MDQLDGNNPALFQHLSRPKVSQVTHNKSYPTPEEEASRFKTFEENVRKITEHNKKYQAGEVTWTQGLNQFADQTQEEFAKHNLGLRRPKAPGLVGSH